MGLYRVRARRRLVGRHATISPSRNTSLCFSPLSRISIWYRVIWFSESVTRPGASCVSSRKLGRTFLKGPKQPLRLCPHCTSTSRNVTSLMTARFGTKRRTKGIVTNHGMPVRWSTAHYRFSRAPCTATLYRPLSLTRSFVSFPLSLSPSASLPSTDDFPVSLSVAPSLSLFLSSTSHRFSSFSFPLSFPLFLWTATVSLARTHSSTVRCASTWRRGTRAAFPPCLSRGVPLSEAITDFSRLLRRHSVPPPPHNTPPPRLPLTLSIRLAPPLDDATRLVSSLPYSLPPILFSLSFSLFLSAD